MQSEIHSFGSGPGKHPKKIALPARALAQIAAPPHPIAPPATAESVDLPRPPSRVQGIKSGIFCAINLVHRLRPVFALNIVRPVPRVQKLESTNEIALLSSCYQGAVTVPSSSDDSIKKIVHFKGVEVATEKSSGAFPVSYDVTTALF